MSEPTQTQAAGTDTSVRRESPLHYACAEAVQKNSADAGIVIREHAHLGHLNLRGDPDSPAFRAAVAEVLGVELPVEPGSCARSDESRLYWLGPNEWLAIVATGTEAAVEAQLRQSLSGHFSIVDISGGQTLISLSGEAVDSVLKKSTVYDFQADNFIVGRCAQTTFAKASGLLIRTADDAFELVIRRSFSDYLLCWIVDAAAEHGIRIE